MNIITKKLLGLLGGLSLFSGLSLTMSGCEGASDLYGPPPCDEDTSWCEGKDLYSCKESKPVKIQTCETRCIDDSKAYCDEPIGLYGPPPVYGPPPCDDDSCQQ